MADPDLPRLALSYLKDLGILRGEYKIPLPVASKQKAQSSSSTTAGAGGGSTASAAAAPVVAEPASAQSHAGPRRRSVTLLTKTSSCRVYLEPKPEGLSPEKLQSTLLTFLFTGLAAQEQRDAVGIKPMQDDGLRGAVASFQVTFRSATDRFLCQRALSCKRLYGGKTASTVRFEDAILDCGLCQLYPRLDLGFSDTAGALEANDGNDTDKLYAASALVVANVPPDSSVDMVKKFLQSGGADLAAVTILRPGVMRATWNSGKAAFLCRRALSGKKIGDRHIAFRAAA
ncbi:unnamed protein product [Amoebophrya sp. A120]|nr:unnamed protein product [Amoebophrya sp. A120]|eukprot:GSA120T00023992001.1